MTDIPKAEATSKAEQEIAQAIAEIRNRHYTSAIEMLTKYFDAALCPEPDIRKKAARLLLVAKTCSNAITKQHKAPPAEAIDLLLDAIDLASDDFTLDGAYDRLAVAKTRLSGIDRTGIKVLSAEIKMRRELLLAEREEALGEISDALGKHYEAAETVSLDLEKKIGEDPLWQPEYEELDPFRSKRVKDLHQRLLEKSKQTDHTETTAAEKPQPGGDVDTTLIGKLRTWLMPDGQPSQEAGASKEGESSFKPTLDELQEQAWRTENTPLREAVKGLAQEAFEKTTPPSVQKPSRPSDLSKEQNELERCRGIITRLAAIFACVPPQWEETNWPTTLNQVIKRRNDIEGKQSENTQRRTDLETLRKRFDESQNLETIETAQQVLEEAQTAQIELYDEDSSSVSTLLEYVSHATTASSHLAQAETSLRDAQDQLGNSSQPERDADARLDALDQAADSLVGMQSALKWTFDACEQTPPESPVKLTSQQRARAGNLTQQVHQARVALIEQNQAIATSAAKANDAKILARCLRQLSGWKTQWGDSQSADDEAWSGKLDEAMTNTTTWIDAAQAGCLNVLRSLQFALYFFIETPVDNGREAGQGADRQSEEARRLLLDPQRGIIPLLDQWRASWIKSLSKEWQQAPDDKKSDVETQIKHALRPLSLWPDLELPAEIQEALWGEIEEKVEIERQRRTVQGLIARVSATDGDLFTAMDCLVQAKQILEQHKFTSEQTRYEKTLEQTQGKWQQKADAVLTSSPGTPIGDNDFQRLVEVKEMIDKAEGLFHTGDYASKLEKAMNHCWSQALEELDAEIKAGRLDQAQQLLERSQKWSAQLEMSPEQKKTLAEMAGQLDKKRQNIANLKSDPDVQKGEQLHKFLQEALRLKNGGSLHGLDKKVGKISNYERLSSQVPELCQTLIDALNQVEKLLEGQDLNVLTVRNYLRGIKENLEKHSARAKSDLSRASNGISDERRTEETLQVG